MAPRASVLLLLGSTRALVACARGSAPRPAAAAADRVAPVVLAPAEIRAEGAVPVAAVFPTLGRYAVSGLQSLQGARLAVEDLNREGGIHGRPLRLAEYRTGSYFVGLDEAARGRQIVSGDTAIRARQIFALFEGALLLAKVAQDPAVFSGVCAAVPVLAGRTAATDASRSAAMPELL